MEFQDKTLPCKDCGNDFVFSAGEQEFYAQKGFENTPARCPDCRNQRKASFKKGNGSRSARKTLYDDVCDACQKPTQVPFQRTGAKPVYCRECFEQKVS